MGEKAFFARRRAPRLLSLALRLLRLLPFLNFPLSPTEEGEAPPPGKTAGVFWAFSFVFGSGFTRSKKSLLGEPRLERGKGVWGKMTKPNSAHLMKKKMCQRNNKTASYIYQKQNHRNRNPKKKTNKKTNKQNKTN